MDFNWSFFFGRNGEQDRNSCGDPKNCGKQSGFHVGKHAKRYIGYRSRRLLVSFPSIPFYGNCEMKFSGNFNNR